MYSRYGDDDDVVSLVEDYVPLFRSMHITGIVRLNKKMYEKLYALFHKIRFYI